MRDACVLTAVGLISAAGDQPSELFSSLVEAVPLSATCRDTADEADHSTIPHVPIAGFDPKRYLKRKGLKNFSRTSQLACAAATRVREAVEPFGPEEVGVVFGTAWASLDTVVRFEREACIEGPRFVDPILFTETVANVPAGQVSIVFGWSALNATVSAGSASGLEALRRAMEFLDEGRAAAVVAGGGDELNRHLLRTLDAEKISARDASSLPFSEGASGPICSEGACLFVVEPASRATARNAEILGRIRAGVGRFIGTGSEAGAAARARLLEKLLDDSALRPTDIDLLILSGNGSPSRDRGEAAAVSAVFGAQGPPVVAPKAILGETWAASGCLGIVVALESMRRAVIPPRPSGIVLAPELAGLNLPTQPLAREVRNAIVLDCSDASHFSALTIAREG